MKEPEKSLAELFANGLGLTLLIALLASVTSYFTWLSKGNKHSWLALISQLLASALFGVMAFTVGDHFGLDNWAVSAVAGVGGWAGTRTMELLEKMLKNWAIHHVEKEKSMMSILVDTVAEEAAKSDKADKR